MLKGKLNIAHGQCHEPEKSRVCSIWFVWKNGDILLVTASLTYMWLHVWAPLRVIKTLTLSLVKNSPQVLSTKLIYSGTLLIQWPVGPKNLPVLTGWPYYRGRLKFHALRAVMTNTPNISFSFLTQLFSFINNQKVDIANSNKIFIENAT